MREVAALSILGGKFQTADLDLGGVGAEAGTSKRSAVSVTTS